MLEIDENLVIIDSVSKRFSACGARVGCVVTKNKELQQALLKFCQSRLSVATIDQLGAAKLYEVDHAFYSRSKEEYRKRLHLKQLLKAAFSLRPAQHFLQCKGLFR